MTHQTETARELLHRHGLPEDIIDGALCLHAQELAAVQRAALAKTDDPVFYEGEAGWLVNLIEPSRTPAAVSAAVAPPTNRAALRDRIAAAVRSITTVGGTPPQLLVPVIDGSNPRMARIVDWQPLDAFLDAVLAVLPKPTDTAAVLREAADDLATAFGDPMVKHIGALGASHLRRRAREIEAGQRHMADEMATETPSMRLARQSVQAMTDTLQRACPPGCVACATDESHDPQPAAGARQSDDLDRIVAYRSLGGRILRCLNHIPPEPEGDFVPVTAEDLPDGGLCTYPECGVDVLIPQPAAEAQWDGAQP